MPSRIDWPAMRTCTACSAPSAPSASRARCRLSGR
ncbi:Uncharacterised protein [Bordetella pertussis]|nr:Uncharacterised protein [Bordetella pertussis]